MSNDVYDDLLFFLFLNKDKFINIYLSNGIRIVYVCMCVQIYPYACRCIHSAKHTHIYKILLLFAQYTLYPFQK